MGNGFIKDTISATSVRNGGDHILQQNNIYNSNQVILASNASSLSHKNTNSANGITFVDNPLYETYDNTSPKKVT